MQRIISLIDDRKSAFQQLPFFRTLEGPGTPEDVRSFVPDLIFFVFTFQDILRLNAARVTTPGLQSIADQHRREDAGHQLWFLNDLEQIGCSKDLGWVFGPEHQATRDASLELAAEVFRATDDHVRVALPLCLEATGDVFFSRVDHFFERADVGGELLYFSRSHHEVELDHEMFEQAQTEALAAIHLDDASLRACTEMAERVFAAMTRMCLAVDARVQTDRALRRAS